MAEKGGFFYQGCACVRRYFSTWRLWSGPPRVHLGLKFWIGQQANKLLWYGNNWAVLSQDWPLLAKGQGPGHFGHNV